jgi:serine/threonine-protein kinase PknG
VLDQAMTSVESVRMDPGERARYRVRILRRALDVVGQGGSPPHGKVGQVAADESSIRSALEESYRALARDADDLKTRVELVNEANAVRNWTLV